MVWLPTIYHVFSDLQKNIRLTAACSLIIYGYNTQQMLLKVLEKSRTPENVASTTFSWIPRDIYF